MYAVYSTVYTLHYKVFPLWLWRHKLLSTQFVLQLFMGGSFSDLGKFLLCLSRSVLSQSLKRTPTADLQGSLCLAPASIVLCSPNSSHLCLFKHWFLILNSVRPMSFVPFPEQWPELHVGLLGLFPFPQWLQSCAACFPMAVSYFTMIIPFWGPVF